MKNKKFTKLVRENTREEFMNKYKTEGTEDCMFLVDDTGNFVLECPWIQNCKLYEDCMKCWDKTLADAKFKGED